MTDDENEHPRGVLMDTEPLTAVVKEDGNGVPLGLEPGMISLRFCKPVTYEEAGAHQKKGRRISAMGPLTDGAL